MNCTEIKTLSPFYISGELDPARMAAFEAHLQSCPACVGELARQRDLDAMLRAGVLAQDVDTSAFDKQVQDKITRSVTRRRAITVGWLSVAAAIVGLLVGIGIAYRVSLQSQPVNVYREVARDHSNEVIHRQPRRWLTDPSAIESLAAQEGLEEVNVAALSTAGYHLERGKVCRLDGRLFLHLVYSDGGREFSLFLRSGENDPLPGNALETFEGRALHAADLADQHLGCFQTRSFTAMIVTNQSRDEALRLVRSAAAVL